MDPFSQMLAFASVGSVILAAVVFTIWAKFVSKGQSRDDKGQLYLQVETVEEEEEVVTIEDELLEPETSAQVDL